MNHTLDTDVLIIGAGPVGLSLAIDLNARGVRTIVAERRHYKQPPSVKCNHVSSRTMEQFRRLGLARHLRSIGLPPDFPNDVVFKTTFSGMELSRIPIPSRATRYTDTSGPDGHWATPEPPHRINQIYLEPALLEHASQLEHVSLINRVEAGAYVQHDDYVEVPLQHLDRDEITHVRAKFLIGCDGGRSGVRKQMGVSLSGTATIQNVQSTYIRAPGLLQHMGPKRAWCTYSVNPRRCGTIFAIDGQETWLIHNHLNPNEPDFDAVDRDTAIRNILGVDEQFEYEILSKEDWVGRRLVADKFRNGRVFICGDAAHLWVPYAGYGMNAGIADAMNLSWHLSAYLAGWADASILDAYQQERQPITQQVSHFAMDHAGKMIAARGAVPSNIEEAGPEGDQVRQQVGKAAYELNVQQFCCEGLNFGYFYNQSPLIAYDGAQAPSYTMGSSQASTVPGCRAPHFWLAPGKSLYDAFGSHYTLLRLDASVNVDSLLQAAQLAGVPLVLLDIPRELAPAEYQHPLILCRADQHIAWRGHAAPDKPHELIDRLCGRQPTIAA